MKWHLITDGFNTGKHNMESDLHLAENCKSNEAFIRFYRWKPYAISLGANQGFDEIDIEKASKDNIDVVKRPTGGRAILHSEEITYSVILPLSIGLSPKDIYKKISRCLIGGLINYDNKLAGAELENIQPHFPSLLKEKAGSVCFASSAKNEVKFDHKKIIGSAQRKLKNNILQHGSILCGTFHKNLINYLIRNDQDKAELKRELDEKTTEIETLLNKNVNYNKLTESLIEGFESGWQINLSKKYEPVFD